MAKQSINVGTTANDKKGDSLRAAFQKVNANFTELYNAASADLQIPSQTANGGKYLTTDGTTLSWATVESGAANLDIYKFQFGIIGTKDNPDTGGWGGYNIALDPGGESWAGLTIPSVASQGAGSSLNIYNNKAVNNDISLLVNAGTFAFKGTGELQLPSNGSIRQNNSWTRTVAPVVSVGAGSVVWTSTVDYISSAKLVIQVEGNEVGDVSGWHSQACEAIIACRGYANTYGGPGGDPQMIVYGVVHTSVDPLVTFTVQRNPITKMVEVVGTLTAAASGNAALRIHSVEMSTRD